MNLTLDRDPFLAAVSKVIGCVDRRATIAVITHSADIPHDAKFFTRTDVPPLILTSRDSIDDTCRRFTGLADVITTMANASIRAALPSAVTGTGTISWGNLGDYYPAGRAGPGVPPPSPGPARLQQ